MRSELAQSSSVSTRTAVARRSRASRLGKTRTLLVRRLISCWIARSMGVGGTRAPPVLLRQGEDGETFGDVVLEPVGEAVGRATVGGDQTIEFFLRGLQRGGVPDPAQLGADPLADGGVGGVVNGVLRGGTGSAARRHRAGRRGGRPSARHGRR